jgi:uncharacterized protein (TIGR02594 family)
LKVDGKIGPNTIRSIEEFQRRVVGMQEPDGVVDPRGQTLRALTDRTPKAEPSSPRIVFGKRQLDVPTVSWVKVAAGEASWIAVAEEEEQLKIKEEKGLDANNPKILEYLSTFGYLGKIWKDKAANKTLADVDETAWCACFVNWCLIKSGRAPGPSARAKDWLSYGTPLDTPVPGAITVIYKKPKPSTTGFSPSGYHVGFYVRGEGASVTLLGGNQGDMVCQKTFVGHTIQGYRWPP